MMENLTLQLKQLSSAEDFLLFFGVPYDQPVVHVNRLHILKRFYQYIRQEPNLPEDNEQALYAVYRDLLIKAYTDFVKSTPAQEKVFKVFQEAEGHQHVTLQNLKSTLPSQGGSVPSFTVPARPEAPRAA
jgi:nitrogenase-stabilizing/protective protein